MKQFSKDLGNVSLVPKGKWSREQEYERLALVYNACDNLSYVAKTNVPSGVDIENREYWQPMNVTGYGDNNFINLTTENENGTITAFDSIEEAVATILPINRRVGATLSFYNLNSDRLDRQAEFELWQFNSTDLANWENKDYWNNIYYNWNVFTGWYISVDSLEKHVKIPNVGQYAYVGANLNDALLYQCRTNGTWTNTGIKVRNYISVVVSGNITIGENGNWFSDGEDTGIPATPAVDEQLDNIIIQLQQHTTEISNLKKSDANLQDQITSNDSDITNLTAKHKSLSKTVQGIAATGGASTATNVTYNNDASGLNAENAQDAIDELQSSKIGKTSILQESGEAKDKVMSQKAVRDAVSKTTKDSRFKETIEVIVPSGTSNANITIQKYTESGGKLYFTIDNSNFPPNISYVGTQIRDDDNLEITTFGNVTNHTLDSFESKYFNIGCYFASEVPSDVHIPIEVVYEQRYKTYDDAIDNKMGLCYVTMYGAHCSPIFNIDFNRKEVTTYNKEFILYDTNATLNDYHGLYIDLKAEEEKTIPFDIESYPDSKIPYWLIYDYTNKEFRVCNYAWMSNHKGKIVFYPVGYGAIQYVDVIDSFKINCDTSFKINGEVYYNGPKQVMSLVDSALKGKISGVVTIESGSKSANVTINQTVMAGYRLRFTIDKSNFPQEISYIGAQIRDDKSTEITTRGEDIFEIDSFNTTNINVAFYFKSQLSKSIDIPFTIDILTYTRQIIEDNVDELKFPFLSIKKSLTVSNGTNNHVDYIYHNFYSKGKIRITIDKSNFPLDISYNGTQIRNDKGTEITTQGANSFEFDSLDSSYLSIGCYFRSNVSKDIVIPYTIEVMLPSPYEEQTRQIIEDISLDGLIPAGISTKRFENFQDFNIYGYGSSVSILKDSSGNYDTPPIEIAGGGISNITVIEDGGFTDHSAYCVHSDNNNAKGKTLRVDNCHFISNSGSCWGVGTRNGYTMEFRNCVFEKTTDSESELSGVCWYSHNTTVDGNIPSLDDKSKVIFIGCTFLSDKKYCMRLQDWNGSTTDYCEWTFINCTFICTSDNTDDAVYIEYKNYPDELGAKGFKHKFSLSEKSCGNNVSWLNYNN
jgi:hypothetical protein